MATTLRSGALEARTPPCAAGGAFGIFNQAKSRVGSHISDTADGRYAPIEAANVVPTFWDVRLIIPSSDPLWFLAFVETESEVLLADRVRSS